MNLFFQTLPVTGYVGNFFKRAHQAISYHMQKTVDDISNLWPVIWSCVFNYLKKATSVEIEKHSSK